MVLQLIVSILTFQRFESQAARSVAAALALMNVGSGSESVIVVSLRGPTMQFKTCFDTIDSTEVLKLYNRLSFSF